MLERIKEWWEDFSFWSTFRLYYWRNGWNRICRFIVWFPIIWKDEDYDSAYVFEILRFKISQVRKSTEQAQRHMKWEKDARNMRIAEELLKRQSFDDFYHENWEKYKEPYCTCPNDRWSDSKKYLKEIQIGERKMYQCLWEYCSFCKVTIKQKIKVEDEQFEFMMNHIKKHIRRWWD